MSASDPGGPLEFCCGQPAVCEYGGCYPYRKPPAAPGDPDFPYMMEDTPEEFERVRRISGRR